MGHLIRVFGQDWYRLAAPERAGRPLGDVLPDWVDPRPVCFTQSPPRNPPPPDFWIFRFKRGKMLEHWDKGLFFDRAAAEFITREEYERRHPGILARDAPEAGEPVTLYAILADGEAEFAVARLIAQHGDAKLTDLLQVPVRCEKAQWSNIYDRCKAVYLMT